jgi:hypothetical protein
VLLLLFLMLFDRTSRRQQSRDGEIIRARILSSGIFLLVLGTAENFENR